MRLSTSLVALVAAVCLFGCKQRVESTSAVRSVAADTAASSNRFLFVGVSHAKGLTALPGVLLDMKNLHCLFEDQNTWSLPAELETDTEIKRPEACSSSEPVVVKGFRATYELQPTRAKMLEEIRAWSAAAGGATLFLAFSGHGSRTGVIASDGATVTFKDIADAVASDVAGKTPKRLVLFLDSCHAGAAASSFELQGEEDVEDSFDVASEAMSALTTEAPEASGLELQSSARRYKPAEVVVMAATQANAVAKDFKGEGGIFSSSATETLRSFRDKPPTFEAWFKEIEAATAKAMVKVEGKLVSQKPAFLTSSTALAKQTVD